MPTFMIIVVSDAIYQGKKRDESGELARRIIEKSGYVVVDKKIVPNDYKLIYSSILDATARSDVVVVIGGTGPSPRDISIDVAEKMAWRRLPGFGEAFRSLSMKEIGMRAILSRAELFIVNKSAVAVIPGAPGSISIALEKILLPIVEHLISEVRRITGEHKLHH